MLDYKKLSEEFTKVLNSKTKEELIEWIKMDKQHCLDEKELEMKTSEKLKILSVLFEAQENGEAIEARPSTSDKWSICKLIDDNIHSSFYHPGLYEYRIKPKSTYRNLEYTELLDLAKNQTKIIHKKSGIEYVVYAIIPINSKLIVRPVNEGYPQYPEIAALKNDYIFKDTGLPVGKEINDK